MLMLQQVLRKKDDPAEGFEWKGQQDYDAVGAAVNKCIGEMLPVVCGLEPIPLVSARTLAAIVDAEPVPDPSVQILLL